VVSTAEPFRLVDGLGGWLEVRTVTLVNGDRCGVATSGQAFIVDPADLPAITAALHEACGQPVPASPVWLRITVPPWLHRILIAAGAQEARDG
jgi:hypothetical protein